MKKNVSLVLALLCFLSLMCSISLTAYSQDKVIELRFSNFFPGVHKNSIIAQDWCKEVEKRTNGKVKITYYPGGILTPPAQTYDSVVKGIADIGESAPGYTRGKFPLSQVIDQPLGYKSGYWATMLINEYFNKFRPKEFDEVKVLYFHAHGPGILFTKKPVNKLEDLKGMRVRSTGFSAKVAQALGATPVAMPQTETYDALRTGIVDGVLNPIEAMKGWKIGEVVNYTIENYGSAYTTSFFVVMNKAKWNSLSPDIQKTIEKINGEWIEKQGKLWDEIDKEGREFMVQRKNKFIALTKEEDARWAEKVKPILGEYVQEMKAKGLPGNEALQFCLDYLRTHEK
ncbi:MAG: C4-dicarboxylate ABC transporter substrate-binding protein [Syntrophus sp. (in: bacteria)]|nr:C4-dicarboxylate ABC transporter substrate-binding protein [Syntrophus sp. (in: bacteria)]